MVAPLALREAAAPDELGVARPERDRLVEVEERPVEVACLEADEAPVVPGEPVLRVEGDREIGTEAEPEDPARPELESAREGVAADRVQIEKDREGLAADRAALDDDRKNVAREVEAALKLATKATVEERARLADARRELETARKRLDEVVRERVDAALAEERSKLTQSKARFAAAVSQLASKEAALDERKRALDARESSIARTARETPEVEADDEPRRLLLRRRRGGRRL